MPPILLRHSLKKGKGRPESRRLSALCCGKAAKLNALTSFTTRAGAGVTDLLSRGMQLPLLARLISRRVIYRRGGY